MIEVTIELKNNIILIVKGTIDEVINKVETLKL